MKQLLIIRHAKSDWGEPGLADFDRPLNKRGHKDAKEMGHRLVNRKIIPELLVSSTALRAMSTAKYFAKALDYEKHDIRKEATLYEAATSDLLNVINHFDNRYNFIALFGHNPGLTDLAVYLSNFDSDNIPTCGMVWIEFPFDDWKMISNGTGDVKLFDYPKNEDR